MLFGGGLTLSAVLKDSGASKVLADGIVFFSSRTTLLPHRFIGRNLHYFLN